MADDPRATPATTVIDGCAIATVVAEGTEHALGHVVVEGNRITAVAAGPAPAVFADAHHVDGTGCLATPGLVNTHDHLYQWATRGFAQQGTLFEWLTTLYPVWAHIDAEVVEAAALAGLSALALSGCTTSSDHHYVFPRGAGDLLATEVAAARRVGLRFHPSRGSMDLGISSGGLPPDDIVEDRDAVLAATEAAISEFHDPAPDAMVRVAVAPCSPFSVTEGLMRDAAELARSAGVRLHTHLAETLDEEVYCRERFGCTPVEYVERLGWLGDDVWIAHGVHLDEPAIGRLAATGTGVAHCPSSNARLGSGIAAVPDLLRAGVPVGIGIDGAASNERGSLGVELNEALLVARLRAGPQALTARDALRIATIGGARCLGRDADLGSLEVGKLADIALWRIDGLGHADLDDPVAALVLGPPAPLALLLVNGRQVVVDGKPTGCDLDDVNAGLVAARRGLLSRAGLAPG
jgi:cytosine/adenosine deaminase-related metal-dependent hydrolase